MPVHVKGSSGVHHLWARPYVSCSVPHFVVTQIIITTNPKILKASMDCRAVFRIVSFKFCWQMNDRNGVKIFVIDDESIRQSVSGVVGWCLKLCIWSTTFLSFICPAFETYNSKHRPTNYNLRYNSMVLLALSDSLKFFQHQSNCQTPPDTARQKSHITKFLCFSIRIS